MRKQANFWALGSMACSQFVHTYFCCFLEIFAYFCETTAKSRLAPAGSDWGNWGYGSHVSLFSVLSVCSVVRIPFCRKLTNHGMHGIHGNEEIGFRCTGKIKLDTGGYKLDMIIQYSEHSALVSFPCFPCVPWFVSHDKKNDQPRNARNTRKK